MMQTDVVTGAFGYSGAVIARGLLAAGHEVRTLTGHSDRADVASPSPYFSGKALVDEHLAATGDNQLTRRYRG